MTSSPEKKHEGWRFKLYQLDAEGQWDDKGTGYVTIKNDEVGVPRKQGYRPRRRRFVSCIAFS